ncbi:hypothetical protein MXB_4365, partial [Myxobolus squamalis]
MHVDSTSTLNEYEISAKIDLNLPLYEKISCDEEIQAEPEFHSNNNCSLKFTFNHINFNPNINSETQKSIFSVKIIKIMG